MCSPGKLSQNKPSSLVSKYTLVSCLSGTALGSESIIMNETDRASVMLSVLVWGEKYNSENQRDKRKKERKEKETPSSSNCWRNRVIKYKKHIDRCYAALASTICSHSTVHLSHVARVTAVSSYLQV